MVTSSKLRMQSCSPCVRHRPQRMKASAPKQYVLQYNSTLQKGGFLLKWRGISLAAPSRRPITSKKHLQGSFHIGSQHIPEGTLVLRTLPTISHENHRKSNLRSPRGSTYTTIRELGPIIPSMVLFLGPNSLIVVYMDPEKSHHTLNPKP